MKRLREILARMGEIRERLGELDELERSDDFEEFDDEQRGEIDTLTAEYEELDAEREPLQRQAELRERVRTSELREIPAVPEFRREVDETEIRLDELHRYPVREVRDAAMKTVERAVKEQDLSPEQAAKVERLLKVRNSDTDGDVIARRMLLTENEHYRTAFAKAVTSPQPAWTSEEARAVALFRAGPQSLTDASGGFGVPVLIDPTIILTTGASDTPILRVARIETITTNIWKGVTSAPASWSYDAEGTVVSDDSVTLAQPSVTTYMARAFIPYTIEVGQDYPNFAGEMRRVLDEGYVQKIAAQSMTGSGSAPQGIFTAIDATAAREVLVTTSGSLTPVDVFTAWNHLGELWRSRASWFSSVSVESQIRNVGADNESLFTVNLTEGGLMQVNGRPWYTSDYAPAFTGTTGTVNLVVVGDFRNYLIAQRAGMSVELVPHLFDVTDNRPTGQRGWFAWARHGMDSINDSAFALLKNAS